MRFFRDNRGTAVLEMALILPVFLFLTVMGTEIGLMVDARVDVAAVAREAGRSAAMSWSASAGRAQGYAAAADRGLDESRLSLSVSKDGLLWNVTARYRYPLLAPDVGGLIGAGYIFGGEEVVMVSRAEFAVERKF